jgi:hypothetical protein
MGELRAKLDNRIDEQSIPSSIFARVGPHLKI